MFRIHTQYCKLFYTVVLSLLMIACGGGGSSDDKDGSGGNGDGGGSGGSGFSFTFTDPSTGQAVEDVSVSLYESDNTTIASTLKSGTDGKVSFSGSANTLSTRANGSGSTFTIAFHNQPENELEIRSIYDLMEGSYNIFIGGDPDEDSCEEAATVDFSYDGYNAAAEFALVSPFATVPTGVVAVQNGASLHNSIVICQHHIQSDNRISPLLLGYNGEGVLVSYGFELDASLTDGASYNGNAGTAPTVRNWQSADTSRNPEAIILRGDRKGVQYDRLGEFFNEDGSLASGQVLAASQFPVDNLFATAVTDLTDSSNCLSFVPLSDSTSDITVKFSDHSFSDTQYDAASETISWILNGSDDSDVFFIDINLPQGTGPELDWNFAMPTSMQTITLPDLPGEIQALFQRSAIGADDISEIAVLDVVSANGFSDVVSVFLQAEDTDELLFSSELFLCSSDEFIEVNTNPSDNNGSDSGSEADVTFSGSGAVQLTTTGFKQVGVTEGQFGDIQFTGESGGIIAVFLNPQDSSQASLVSFTDGGNSKAWISDSESGMVIGTAVGASEVEFTNTPLESDDGSQLILNGKVSR